MMSDDDNRLVAAVINAARELAHLTWVEGQGGPGDWFCPWCNSIACSCEAGKLRQAIAAYDARAAIEEAQGGLEPVESAEVKQMRDDAVERLRAAAVRAEVARPLAGECDCPCRCADCGCRDVEPSRVPYCEDCACWPATERVRMPDLAQYNQALLNRHATALAAVLEADSIYPRLSLKYALAAAVLEPTLAPPLPVVAELEAAIERCIGVTEDEGYDEQAAAGRDALSQLLTLFGRE